MLNLLHMFNFGDGEHVDIKILLFFYIIWLPLSA